MIIILLAVSTALITALAVIDTIVAAVATLNTVILILLIVKARNYLKTRKANGTLSINERKFIDNNGLHSDEFIDKKPKTFNELNLAQRMNDVLYLQKSLSIKNKMQSEIAVGANILEEFSDLKLPIENEVVTDMETSLEIYKSYSKKLKGRTTMEKLLNSNGIKYKAYFTKIPALLFLITTLLVGFLTTSAVATGVFSLVTMVMLGVSLKEKRKLNKKQNVKLKLLVFNLVSEIEKLNDDILGFVRRNEHVLEKVSGETLFKYEQLLLSVDTKNQNS